ncbi:MAG: hypothetical protein MJ149_00160, partial [Clostridia bacterium]|nr:hypothetical protein [Clostridia bacterium]
LLNESAKVEALTGEAALLNENAKVEIITQGKGKGRNIPIKPQGSPTPEVTPTKTDEQNQEDAPKNESEQTLGK